ncbi:general secretion pathway protein K [Rhizobium sp. RU20A]|uniref:general secretion pathway protein GspK n=1 Tax=Rhizobium sp. RU20A TaxID=1907412 RepID=UPI000956DA5C|nr:type II secretion system protein GspK [Rhizobium sp. RU20A]SIQ86387.1 general secretion pathway protein K [Rhizobium sp. RU20A]
MTSGSKGADQRAGHGDPLGSRLPFRPAEETSRDGFVLISVLIVALLFVAVTGSLAVRARLFVLQERNRAETVALQTLADGAARLVALDLATGRFSLPPDGTTGTCKKGDLELRVSAIDQEMLLDLNGAPPEMIVDVLTAIGIDETDARRLAAQIVDYRDPDDRSQPLYGAEAAEYARAGLPWRPKNTFFADVSEFAQLPAATPPLIARIAPILTINNPRASIDPTLINRLSATPSAANEALSRWLSPSRQTRFAVMIELRAPGRATASRTATIAVGGENGLPQFLKWARNDMAGPPEAAGQTLAVSDASLCSAVGHSRLDQSRTR